MNDYECIKIIIVMTIIEKQAASRLSRPGREPLPSSGCLGSRTGWLLFPCFSEVLRERDRHHNNIIVANNSLRRIAVKFVRVELWKY
jgi:hypothetical protein